MDLSELQRCIVVGADGAPVSPSASGEPIPVREGNRVVIVGFRYSWFNASNGSVPEVHVSGPHDKYVIDPETGALLRHEKMPYGAIDLGRGRDRGLTDAQAKAIETGYADAFGPLLEAFSRGGPRPASLDREAKAMKAYYDGVVQEELMPYYRSLGAEWFAWLDM